MRDHRGAAGVVLRMTESQTDLKHATTAAEPDNHVAGSIESLNALHREHHEGSSALQNGIDRITDLLGRPIFALVLAGAVAAWIVLASQSPKGIHGPTFAWLELSATLAALFVAVLILVTQRRENQLSERRAQLTLQLAMLADKKTAKLIALIEELRRDMPTVHDRIDDETAAMEKPTDPRELLDAIETRDAKSPG